MKSSGDKLQYQKAPCNLCEVLCDSTFSVMQKWICCFCHRLMKHVEDASLEDRPLRCKLANPSVGAVASRYWGLSALSLHRFLYFYLCMWTFSPLTFSTAIPMSVQSLTTVHIRSLAIHKLTEPIPDAWVCLGQHKDTLVTIEIQQRAPALIWRWRRWNICAWQCSKTFERPVHTWQLHAVQSNVQRWTWDCNRFSNFPAA